MAGPEVAKIGLVEDLNFSLLNHWWSRDLPTVTDPSLHPVLPPRARW